MDSQILDANRHAQSRLLSLIGSEEKPSVGPAAAVSTTAGLFPTQGLTLLLMPNEANAAHGTGILAARLLRDVNPVALLRTYTQYDGTCLLNGPDVALPPITAREDIFAYVVNTFRPGQIKHVVCVPWGPQELHIAIALKRIFNVPLTLWLMDDNCLYQDGIPRELLAEAIDAADIVFAISPEMQNAYQDVFRRKVWLLPPILDPSLLGRFDDLPTGKGRGVVVGNIWWQSALDRFCDALRDSSVNVDWYCNTSAPSWLTLDRDRLADAGITFCSPIPEPSLVEVLREAPFAILPSSTLEPGDPTQNIGRLSLPSRIPFIITGAATPVIVVGSPQTSAGAFVEHFNVGAVADYSGPSLKKAVETVTAPGFRRHVAETASQVAEAFSSRGMSDWVYAAAQQGRPLDSRFEKMLGYRRHQFGYYVPTPAPDAIFPDFRPAFEALERLQLQGLQPDFVIDVGASTGVWSATVGKVFPHARFILVDPLLGRYPQNEVQQHLSMLGDAIFIEAAASDAVGALDIQVSDNLYGSSLMGIGSGAAPDQTITVPVTTLDTIKEEMSLSGRGLLKIDVQFAEHLVIKGGRKIIQEMVDCIVIELTIERVHPSMKTFLEITNLLDDLGFRWADQAGEWRSLSDGRLEQIDVVFIRKDLLPPLPMVA